VSRPSTAGYESAGPATCAAQPDGSPSLPCVARALGVPVRDTPSCVFALQRTRRGRSLLGHILYRLWPAHFKPRGWFIKASAAGGCRRHHPMNASAAGRCRSTISRRNGELGWLATKASTPPSGCVMVHITNSRAFSGCLPSHSRNRRAASGLVWAQSPSSRAASGCTSAQRSSGTGTEAAIPGGVRGGPSRGDCEFSGGPVAQPCEKSPLARAVATSAMRVGNLILLPIGYRDHWPILCDGSPIRTPQRPAISATPPLGKCPSRRTRPNK
jgi:hypothetical protein